MSSVMPSVKDLIESSSRYAQSALDSHNAQEHDRIAVLSGISLEHITKACIAKRHPALLLDLKQEGSWKSLKTVLMNDDSKIEKIRTISLETALKRVRDLFTSNANEQDLDTLIELRNGAVHIAVLQPFEDRLLVAFLRQLDASLSDLAVSKEAFWGGHLRVVEAMLSSETDRVKKEVALKVSQCRLSFEQRIAGYSQDIKNMITNNTVLLTDQEESYICTVCRSNGVADGEHEFEYTYDQIGDEDFDITDVWVNFTPDSFRCEVCGLKLKSIEEMNEAGFDISPIRSDMEPGQVNIFDSPLSDDD